VLKNTIEPLPIKKLLEICNRSDRTKFRKAVLNPLIENGLVETTAPEAPRSPKQKYVITKKGKEWMKQHKK
jgi:ATP-dependent DNA helicase RecG